MMSKNDKKTRTLLQKRKLAIVAVLLLIALLIPTLIISNLIIKSYPYDDIDGTRYWLKYRNGEFSMYDGNGNKLPVDPDYGFFITDIGTLVSIDVENGTIDEIIVPDTEHSESVDASYPTRIMIYERVLKEDISSIDVVNMEGEYTFYRYNPITDKIDAKSDFSIKQAPFADFSQEKFATLYTDAGYTLVKNKVVDPIKDANGEYTEYGLAPEKRVNEDGEEYDYVPAYFVLTKNNGDKHKIIVGDELVNGAGYYAQYVDISGDTEIKRDTVYIIASTVKETVLKPIEEYVTPMIVYPMTLTTYLDVDNFTISVKDPNMGTGRRQLVGFSFVDQADRENTILSNYNYKFDQESFKGYIPDPENVEMCLNNLYKTDFERVVRVNPSEEELIEYGLANQKTNSNGETVVDFDSEYSIIFDYDKLDDNDKYVTTYRQLILISKPNESGNYYAYTLVYDGTKDTNEFLFSFDMIVEVRAHAFDFLTWDSYKWINGRFLSVSIPYCESIEIETPSLNAEFFLDNSESDLSESANTDNLKVVASHSNGTNFTTFSGITAVDRDGNVWKVTPTTITATTKAGVSATIANAYYADNAMGRRVRVLTAPIICADGTKVAVSADTVVVTKPNEEPKTYIRYGTTLFRTFYQSLISSDIQNSYVMTEEEEAALIADSSKWLMTIRIKTTDGNVNEYKLYFITNRKAYLTINGNGGFYVNSARIAKIENDIERFFNFEVIDPSAKT